MRIPLRGNTSRILKILVTLVALGAIIWLLGGLQEVGKQMVKISPGYFVLILGVITLDRALMTFKWSLLLRSRGQRLSLLKGMQIYCAAMVWGMFLPVTMGADAIRAYSTSRRGVDADDVIASIIIERMIGFLSALLIGLGSLFLLARVSDLGPDVTIAFQIGWATLLVAVIVFALSFSEPIFNIFYRRLPPRVQAIKFVDRIRSFHKNYRAFQHHKKILAIFFILTLLEQLFPILHNWLIALGIGAQASFPFVAGAVSLAMLISRIPISIDGLGVFDGAFLLVMSLAGIPPSQSIAITLLGRITQTLAWLPWWASFVLQSGSVSPPRSFSTESSPTN